MIIPHKLNMDLQIQNAKQRMNMVQNDIDSRAIEISITSSGTAWMPETLDNVILRYRKSDGTGGSYDTLPDGTKAWEAEENVVTILMAPQILTVPGLVEAQIVLIYGSRQIATPTFQIAVEADPSIGAVESENYINWTQWAKKELDAHLEQAKESGDFAGAYFLPAVDDEGNLSWTNDGGLENPEPVNIADMVAGKLNGDILQGNMTEALNMNGNKITGLAEPEADTDAATKGFVRNLVKKAGPRNLLDNSDFRNPVNQRGQTNYSGVGYSIDRWKAVSANSELYINADKSVSFATASEGTDTYWRQYLPMDFEYLKGKTFTLAAKDALGNICVSSGVYPYSVPTQVTVVVWTTMNENTSIRFYADVTGAGFVQVNTTNSIPLVWAALYEGEYTAETLPEYQPKGYAVELLECQRYFVRYGKTTQNNHIGYAQAATSTVTNAVLCLSQSMRITTPTATVSGKLVLRNGVTDIEVTSVVVSSCNSGAFAYVALNASGLTVGQMYAVRLALGTLDFSADL